MASEEALLDTLYKSLNKGTTRDPVAKFLTEENDNISDWISTGSKMLDLIISNRKEAGLPVGRIIEFSGLEGCLTEDARIRVMIEE